MSALLGVVAPVFLIVAAGALFVRMGWMGEAGIDGLAKFAQSFAIPCLLFRAIATLDLGAALGPALLASFYVPAILCFGIGFFAARRLLGRSAEDAVAIGFCCLFSNSVLLGLPITERAFGVDALDANYAIIAFHAPVCYGLGIAAMETARAGLGRGALRQIASKAFGNALILGIAAGAAVNLSGLAIPGTLDAATEIAARAALPAALFGLGGVIARYRIEGDLRAVAAIAAISLLIHPSLTWLAGAAANLPQEAFRSAVLTAAMAPGVNAFLFASMYGRAMRVAAASVLVATAASLGTASIWLALLSP